MTDYMAIVTKSVRVEIIDYPGSLQSAVFGVKEFLQMANNLDSESETVKFQVEIKHYGDLSVSSANSNEEA